MSGSVAPATALVPLPPAIRRLLESFSETHADAALRVWVQEDDGWTCIYPGGTGEEAPPSDTLPLGEESVRLEVAGMPADHASLRFLRAALERAFSYEREARLAARELTERYEEINLLYSISEILGSVLSLEESAGRILAEVVDLLGARRASLWVFDPGEDRLDLAAAVGDDGVRGPIATDDPNSITALVFRERQAVNLERGTLLPRGTQLDWTSKGREAFLSVPIQYSPPEGGARMVGVITLIGGRGSDRFSAGDTRLLTAIASQVGAALETNRLIRESLKQERLVRELELAHDLQLKLLPTTAEFAGPAEVAARCAPADSVGGDFYHLFRLSDERFGVMIGDVSGHGFSAALIMALAMSAVGIYARDAGPPAEVLRRVHHALADELETTEMYLSLFYGVIEPKAGRLVYANAGHPGAFRVRAGGGVKRLDATDPPLGMLPMEAYGEAVADWEAGEDLLCLFTDGLSDAFGPARGVRARGPAELDGASAGEAKLLSEVVRLRDRPAAEILERLFEAADEVRLDIPADDRTAVLVRA